MTHAIHDTIRVWQEVAISGRNGNREIAEHAIVCHCELFAVARELVLVVSKKLSSRASPKPQVVASAVRARGAEPHGPTFIDNVAFTIRELDPPTCDRIFENNASKHDSGY